MAAVSYWKGDISADWGTAGNWDSGVPTGIAGFKYASPWNQPSVGGVGRTVTGVQMDSTSGPVTISADSGGSLTINGNVFVHDASGGLTITAPIVGGSGLTKTGGGMLTLSIPNTVSGPIAINAGALRLAWAMPTDPAGAAVYYSFNDAVNPGNDDSGNWINGTVVGAAAAGGIAGGALAFNGASNQVWTQYSPSETDYGVSFWVKANGDNAGIFSVTNDDGGANDRHLYTTSGQVGARVWNNEIITTSGVNVSDGNWHHIVHTFGGAVGGEKIYIDGVLRASGARALSDFNWDTRFHIGYSVDGASDWFNGVIDEFRLYDRALEPADVATLYGQGSTNYLDDLAAVTVASGATLDLNSISETIGSLADHPTLGGGAVSLGSAALTAGGNEASTTFSGVISGSGGLVKTGDGIMTLTGASTYTGPTTINAGTIRAGSVDASGGASSIGAGTSPVVLGGVTTQGTLSYTGGDATLSRGFTVSKGGGRIDHAGSGTLTIATAGITGNADGNLTLGGTGNIAVAAPVALSNGSLTVSGVGNTTTIAGPVGLGSGGLTKNGSGIMVLSAPANYSGATTISQGTLRLTPTLGPPVGGASFWVDATKTSTLNIASDGSARVSEWWDAAGAAGKLSQIDPDRQPTYVDSGINGLPVLHFDGANDIFTGAYANSTDKISVFAVMQRTAVPTTTCGPFSFIQNGQYDHNNPSSFTVWNGGSGGPFFRVHRNNATVADFSPHPDTYVSFVSDVIFDGAKAYAYINGALGATSNASTGPFNINQFSVGGRLEGAGGVPATYWPGDFGEVLIYNTALNETDRQAIEKYLTDKWLGGGGGGGGAAVSLLPDASPVSVASGAVLDINGCTETIGPLSGAGGITLGSVGAPGALTVNSTADSTFSGVISGSGTLRKGGAGTLTLSAANTYAGPTTVNAGKLLVVGPGSLTSAVTVTGGGVLGGSGSVGGVTVASGGHFAPGTDAAPVGTLATSTLSLATGGIVDFEFASATSYDQITVGAANGLSINGGGINLYQVGSLNPYSTNGTYTLVTASGSIGGGGVSTLSLLNRLPEKRYTLATSGSNVTLTIANNPRWIKTSGNWSLSTNWQYGLPQAGDALVFSLGSGESRNDLSSGPFTSLRLKSGISTGLTLTGNAVTLSGDCTGYIVLNESVNTPVVNLPIIMSGSGAIGASSAAGPINVTGTIDNGGNLLVVKGPGNTTLNGAISGAGGLSKQENGILTLGAANTFTGDTRIGGGTLALNHAQALQASTLDMNAADSGTLSIGALTNAALGGLSGSRNLNLGAAAVSIGVNNATTIYSGVLSGGNGLTKSGTGRLTLQGANTYGGGTVVSGGTLAAAGPGALSNGTVTLNGGTLSLNSLGSTLVSGFGGNGAGWTVNSVNITSTPITADVLTLTDNAGSEARSAYFNTKVPVSGFKASFVYQASGNRGADGVTCVFQNQGLNALGGGGGLMGYEGITPSAAIAINIYNGHQIGTNAFLNGNMQGYTYNATGSVNVASGDRIRFDLSYDGATLTETLTDLDQPANTWSTSYTGIDLKAVLGDDAYVGFTGATGGAWATQTISNFSFTPTANTYVNNVQASAATSSTIAVVASSSVATFQMGTLTVGADATLNLKADDGSPADQAYGLTLGAATLAGGATFNVANNGNGLGTLTLGDVSGPAGTSYTVTKNGPGVLVFSGAATYTGNTTITDGVLRTSPAGVPRGVLTFNGAADAVPILEASGTMTRAAGVVQWLGSGGFSARGGPLTLQLNGGEAFTWGSGNFVPNGSSLVFGSASADNAVDFQNAIDLGNTNRTITVQKSAISNSDAAQISGRISGTGGFTKAGPGVLALAGNNTFTGGVTVNAGLIRVANAGALNTASPNSVTFAAGSAGRLQLAGTSVTVGGLTSSDDSPIVENATVTPATLTVAGPGYFAGVIRDGAGGGPLGLTKSGSGTLELRGANAFTGPITVNGGVLLGDAASLRSNITTGAMVQFDQATDGGYNRRIDGTGGLTKSGVGVLTLSTATESTYRGPTIIRQGTLRLANAPEVPEGASLYYSFDNPDDLGKNDLGTGYDGTIVNATAGPGVSSGGLEFSGLGYLRSPLSPSETAYAVSLWVKTTFIGDQGIYNVCGPGPQGGENDRNIFVQGGQTVARVWLDSRDEIISANVNVTDGNWHHVVHTYGSAIGGQRLYIDGVEQASGTLASYSAYNDVTDPRFVGHDQAITLGRTSYPAVPDLSGWIDETRIYAQALTQDDVTLLYQNGLRSSTAGRIGDLSPVRIAANATLDLDGVSETIGSLADDDPAGAAGEQVLLGSGTLTTGGNDGSTVFSGAISGTGGSLIKTGKGVLELSGPNTYDGGTTVQSGTLKIGNPNALPAGCALTIDAGGTLVLASGLSAAGAASLPSGAAPVPEPGTLVLLAAGVLAGLAAGLGRRAK